METFRDRANIIAIECSAAEIVFTSGVFITIIPLLVASSMSILSTPTPARPIAFNFFAALIIFLSIFVPLLMIHPSVSSHALIISSFEALYN